MREWLAAELSELQHEPLERSLLVEVARLQRLPALRDVSQAKPEPDVRDRKKQTQLEPKAHKWWV